jgi:hypothetical protein
MASHTRHTTAQPVLAGLLVSACLVATVPGLVVRDLAVFAGDHPWAPLTAGFAHGLPGVPAAAHLFVAVAFLLLVGVPAERLVGTPRFAAVATGALAVAAAVSLLADTAVGATVFAWAGAPLLAAGLRVLRSEDAAGGRWARRAVALLVALVVGVPALTLAGAVSTAAPLGPALAATAANALSGAVGVAGVLAWRPAVEDSLFYGPSADHGLGATAAVAVYAALVAFLLVLLVLALAGVIN